MGETYAYLNPVAKRWIGEFSSRSSAANALLTRHSDSKDGFTAPILTTRGDQPIIDPNSVVRFTYDIAHPYSHKEIMHDRRMLSQARTA